MGFFLILEFLISGLASSSSLLDFRADWFVGPRRREMERMIAERYALSAAMEGGQVRKMVLPVTHIG